MPRVRILAGIAGEGRSPGEVLDLPANEAQYLIEQQRAELVRAEAVETPERAVPRERTRRRKANASREGV